MSSGSSGPGRDLSPSTPAPYYQDRWELIFTRTVTVTLTVTVIVIVIVTVSNNCVHLEGPSVHLALYALRFYLYMYVY